MQVESVNLVHLRKSTTQTKMKVIAAILVAFLAIQTTTQTPLQETSSKDVIVKLLDVVLSITEKLVENAQTLNSLLEQNQENIVSDAETYLAAIGVQINNLVVTLIDQLKEGATEDGVAVLECIDAEETATNAAFSETINLAANCLAEESPALLAVANQILEHIQSVEEKVKTQVESLDSCTDSDLVCLLSFVNSASSLGDEIKEIVTEDVQAVVAVAKEAVSHVASCQLLDNVKTNTQQIFNDIVLCINKA